MRRKDPARGAYGDFKFAPRPWEQLYTEHAATQGYVLPCVYALLPDKTGATYHIIWRQAREASGGSEAPNQRLATIDFERASTNNVQGVSLQRGSRAATSTSASRCAEMYGGSESIRSTPRKMVPF